MLFVISSLFLNETKNTIGDSYILGTFSYCPVVWNFCEKRAKNVENLKKNIYNLIKFTKKEKEN